MKTNPIEPKKELSPEEKRVRIAEACGWRWLTRAGDKSTWLFGPNAKRNGDTLEGVCGENFIPEIENSMRLGPAGYLPDYLGDLNAMHEAEKIIMVQPLVSGAFQDALQEICLPLWLEGKWLSMRPCHATAAQRADAFLAAIASANGGAK